MTTNEHDVDDIASELQCIVGILLFPSLFQLNYEWIAIHSKILLFQQLSELALGSQLPLHTALGLCINPTTIPYN